jgi:hypothetical protein
MKKVKEIFEDIVLKEMSSTHYHASIELEKAQIEREIDDLQERKKKAKDDKEVENIQKQIDQKRDKITQMISRRH